MFAWGDKDGLSDCLCTSHVRENKQTQLTSHLPLFFLSLALLQQRA